MGYYKDLYIEYTEWECSPNIDVTTDKFLFGLEMYRKLRSPYAIRPSEGSLVRQFLYEVFPELRDGQLIWGMASLGASVYNFCFSDVENAVRDLTILSGEDVNLFFSPAVFTGWRKDKNVSAVNAIYIDIDHIGIDFYSMDESQIREYICDTYKLEQSMLPNWVVATGHGLHLYYIVDTLNLQKDEECELRLRYTDYLIHYFKADPACRNKSRILRFPGSHNVKDRENIRPVRLFHMNMSLERALSRLDFFASPQDEIDAYITDCWKERGEKRKATMLANGTTRKKSTPRKTVSKRDSVTIEDASPDPEASPPDLEYAVFEKSDSHPELRCSYAPLNSKSRYKKVLRDLHNWASRRNGVPVGFRAIFTHIMAVFLKRVWMTRERAIECLSAYLDEDFMDEAEAIVKSVYDTKTKYMYSNRRIAELLDFTEYDFEHSICCYTDEQRKSARKKSNADYDAKRYWGRRESRKATTAARQEFITEHPEMTASEQAETLRCSVRTIRYIRAKIKNEQEP